MFEDNLDVFLIFVIKVHIFWERHKYITFLTPLSNFKYNKISSNFSGPLRIYELWLTLNYLKFDLIIMFLQKTLLIT